MSFFTPNRTKFLLSFASGTALGSLGIIYLSPWSTASSNLSQLADINEPIGLKQNAAQGPHQLLAAYKRNNSLISSDKLNQARRLRGLTTSYFQTGVIKRIKAFEVFDVILNSTDVKAIEQPKSQSKSKTDQQIPLIRQISFMFIPTASACQHLNIQHGGLSATVIDRMMGVVGLLATRKPVATAQLRMTYRKPVRKGNAYVGTVKIHQWKGRDILIEGLIEELSWKSADEKKDAQGKGNNSGNQIAVNKSNQQIQSLQVTGPVIQKTTVLSSKALFKTVDGWSLDSSWSGVIGE